MPKFKDLKMAITYFKKLLKNSNFQLLFIKMSKFYQDLEIVMGGTEDCVSVEDQISASLASANNPIPISHF